jgi:diacylglycerol O-acyltransferase/trehalose O-mycolyltransferase
MALTVRTGSGMPGEFDHGRKPDPVEAMVFHQSTRLHNRLRTLGIEHTWHHGRGTHDWPYWIRDLRETAPLLAKVFADPPAPPRPFSFTSADREFEVWGWQVRFPLPQRTFALMSKVDKEGFALTGEGAPTVRSAAWYEPGTEYPILVHAASDCRCEVLRADRDGHLTFSLRLGHGGTARVEIGAAR